MGMANLSLFLPGEAMSKPPPPPPTPPASETSSSVAAAAPRSLPPTLLLPPSSSGNRGARGGSIHGSAAGSRKGKAPVGSAAGAEGGRHQNDRLVEAVRLVGREVDPGVAGADILELAMAKGPMFSWLRYWPEEGYPEEGRPY